MIESCPIRNCRVSYDKLRSMLHYVDLSTFSRGSGPGVGVRCGSIAVCRDIVSLLLRACCINCTAKETTASEIEKTV